MKRPLVAAMHARRCVNAYRRCCAAQASRVSPAVSSPRSVARASPRPGGWRASDRSSALFLQMRLEEPEVLVDVAGNSREEVRRVRVAELVRVIDGRPYRLAEGRQLRRQIKQMILARGDGERIVFQFAAFGGHGNRAFGGTAQARHPFGDLVDLFQYQIGDLVEQLVQSDEMGTFDVPMRLLDLALQIDRIGQAIVEYEDDVAADFLRQVNLGLVHRRSF